MCLRHQWTVFKILERSSLCAGPQPAIQFVRYFWALVICRKYLTCCFLPFRNGKCKKIEEGQECLQGMRLRQYHMLCGALLRVWKRVSDVVSDITSSSILQIVRLKTKQHNKQVGQYMPSDTTDTCMTSLGQSFKMWCHWVFRVKRCWHFIMTNWGN